MEAVPNIILLLLCHGPRTADHGPTMLNLYESIQEARQAIEQRWKGRPTVGIILGTGLGGFAEDIQAEAAIPYSEIPHFPESTVQSPSLLGRRRWLVPPLRS